jgi:hypothetical protein
MEIHVSTTFLGTLTQNKFFVRTIDEKGTNEYECSYEAGEWNFQMSMDGKLILESQRIKLSGKKTFLGHQSYKLLWEGNEIGMFNRSYLKKEITFDGRSYSFPKLFKLSIADLGLKFPLRTWIYRRNVKSNCTSTEPTKIMLAIAMTIFVWFTWNALPAD